MRAGGELEAAKRWQAALLTMASAAAAGEAVMVGSMIRIQWLGMPEALIRSSKEIVFELPDVADAVGARELEDEVNICEATLQDGVELACGPHPGLVLLAIG